MQKWRTAAKALTYVLHCIDDIPVAAPSIRSPPAPPVVHQYTHVSFINSPTALSTHERPKHTQPPSKKPDDYLHHENSINPLQFQLSRQQNADTKVNYPTKSSNNMQTRSMKIKERILSGKVLHKLPAEVLGIIATRADDKWLASLRATCREIRDGSAFEFLRRYTSLNVRLTGTLSGHFSNHYLAVDTKSPDVITVQAMAQSLILPESYTTFWATPQNEKILRELS